MKISLTTFQQSRNMAKLWLVPVFQGQVEATAQELNFEAQAEGVTADTVIAELLDKALNKREA